MTIDHSQPEPINLLRIADRVKGQRIAWSASSEQLNVNLIILQQDERIDVHTNDEVDVLIVGIDGVGEITIGDVARRITPSAAVVVPRGVARGMSAVEAPFAYLTCHQQRATLWPTSTNRRAGMESQRP